MSSYSPSHESSRHAAGLLLRVTRTDGHSDEFYLANGLTIGRTLANTIVLTDDSVDRAHARVEITNDGSARLRCVEPDSVLTIDGQAVRELPLDAGIRFGIGRTEFQCVSGQRGSEADSHRAKSSCPFCGSTTAPKVGQGLHRCPICTNLILPILIDPHDSAPILVPVAYGGYRAEHYLARGGMGLVLKGANKEGMPVAIKVLLAGTDLDRRQDERFDQEVEMLSRVRHSNVVKLLDHGTSGPFNYLVMEWIEGPSLRQVIADANRAGKLTDFTTALLWFKEVCKGLAAIHAVGMVHRDVKPSNILIGPDNVARITDLGIAKRIDAAHTSYTTTGHAPGTYEYMAPEQINAPDTIDGRVDLYAMGATFHELLTGARPVGAWRPASMINPSVPDAFDEIIERLLAPRPEHRHSDIYEVLSKLADDQFTHPEENYDGPGAVETRVRRARGRQVLVKSGQLLRIGSRAVAGRLTAMRRPSGIGAKVRTSAHNGAIWGMCLLGIFGGLILLPVWLIALAITVEGEYLSLIVGYLIFIALSAGLGLLFGGLGGAIVGAIRKTNDDDALVRSVGVREVMARIFTGFGRLWHSRQRPYLYEQTETNSSGSSTGSYEATAEDELRQEYATIFRQRRIYLGLSWAFGLNGLFLLLAGGFYPNGLVGGLYQLCGWLFWLAGIVLAARYKGRSILSGLVMSCFPILVICFWDRNQRRLQELEAILRSKGGPPVKPAPLPDRFWLSLFLPIIYPLAPIAFCLAVRDSYRDSAQGRNKKARAFATVWSCMGCAFLLIGIMGLAFDPMPLPAQTYTERASSLIQANQLDEAIAACDEAVRLDPSLPAAYSLRAQARYMGQQFDAAIADASTALGLDPRLANAYNTRGMAQMGKGRLDQAIADLDAAIQLNPALAIAFSNRALARLSRKELDLAIIDADRALGLNPTLAEALIWRGVAHRDKGTIDQAIADLTSAVSLDLADNGTIALAFNHRGVAYLANGEHDRAIADFGAAIDRDPQLSAGYSNRGLAYLSKDDLDRALVDCDKAIALDSSNAEALLWKGTILDRKGEHNHAIDDLSKSIEFDPNQWLAYNNRGLAYLNKNKFHLALTDFDKAIQMAPDNPTAVTNRGLCKKAIGLIDEAIADFRAARELDLTNESKYDDLIRAAEASRINKPGTDS